MLDVRRLRLLTELSHRGTIAAVAKPEFARFAFPTDTAVAG